MDSRIPLAAATIAILPTITSADPPSPPAVQVEIDDLRAEIAAFRTERAQATIQAERVAASEARWALLLADVKTRPPAVPTRWNEIASPDGDFTLRFNFYEQFDWVLNKTEGLPVEKGFTNFHSRMTFSGNVFGPDWGYVIRLSFGSTGTGDAEFAFIQRRLGRGWSLQAGLITPYFSLEEAIDTTETLGTSLSWIAGQFDPENTEGVQLSWQGTDARVWAAICNGWSAEDRSWEDNARMAVIGRAEWKPFGDWTDLYFFNPYPDHVVDGLLFGIGGAFGAGDSAPPGGSVLDGPATRLTTDFAWQRPGLGFAGSLSWQDAEAGGDLSGRRIAATLQGALMPLSTWSIYARGEWGSIPGGDRPDLGGMTVGTSWFPAGDATVKLTIECLGMFGDTVDWRTDGDPAILPVDADQFAIRSQVQVSF